MGQCSGFVAIGCNSFLAANKLELPQRRQFHTFLHGQASGQQIYDQHALPTGTSQYGKLSDIPILPRRNSLRQGKRLAPRYIQRQSLFSRPQQQTGR